MKTFFKWAAIAIGLLVAYAFFETLSESRKNLLSITFAIGLGCYFVMDFIQEKHRELERRIYNLHAKLDDLEKTIPTSWEIASEVRRELDRR